MNNDFVTRLIHTLKTEQEKELQEMAKMKTLLEQANERLKNRADTIKLLEASQTENNNQTVGEILGYRKV